MRSSLDMSQQSVDSIREARDSFEGIRASVDEIRDQSTQIATAAEEQHQVAEDINQHIIQIQADAQLIEELAGSAQADSRQLNELSKEFQEPGVTLQDLSSRGLLRRPFAGQASLLQGLRTLCRNWLACEGLQSSPLAPSDLHRHPIHIHRRLAQRLGAGRVRVADQRDVFRRRGEFHRHAGAAFGLQLFLGLAPRSPAPAWCRSHPGSGHSFTSCGLPWISSMQAMPSSSALLRQHRAGGDVADHPDPPARWCGDPGSPACLRLSVCRPTLSRAQALGVGTTTNGHQHIVRLQGLRFASGGRAPGSG
ncbi:hypothetical protein L1887_51783 [Cichorium endivia]|nr:hypothetical protein L1887_51783 [Cichorium endivia]